MWNQVSVYRYICFAHTEDGDNLSALTNKVCFKQALRLNKNMASDEVKWRFSVALLLTWTYLNPSMGK